MGELDGRTSIVTGGKGGIGPATARGTVLTVQRAAVDTAGMFATIIVLCVVASGAYALIQLWESRSRIIESLD